MNSQLVHINCDLGEGGEQDAQLMQMISACNIACGGHAGNLESMRETVSLAMENNVQIGAHPSYPDKENFGRKSLEMDSEKLQQSLMAQILSLKQITESEGGRLSHVKPHGALYNDAANSEKIARVVIDAVLEFDKNLPLFAPENSVISHLAEGKIEVVFEAFADRNYTEDYRLVSRQNPNALITKKQEVFRHLFSMISEGKITTKTGVKISCKAGTFCLHSDTPNAVEILVFLKHKLAENNLQILRDEK